MTSCPPAWTVLSSREEYGGNLPLLSLSAEHGVRERVASEGRAASEDTSGYRVVRPGDVVINRLSAREGAIAVSALEGLVSPAYWVLVPTRNAHGWYLHYLLRSAPYQSEIARVSKWMPPAQFDLPWSQFRRIRLRLPDIHEQKAIADFLGDETARLDALIAKKRQLLNLMSLRRDAAAGEAIDSTEGDSLPLRRVVEAFIDYRGATPEKADAGVPLVTATNVSDGEIDLSLGEQFLSEETYVNWMCRGFPEVGDIVLTTEAPLGEIAIVTDPRIALAQRIILLKPDRQRVQPEFLYASLRSPRVQADLLSRASGSTVWGIRADRLRDVRLHVPSLPHQQRIVTKLRCVEHAYRRGRGLFGNQIDLLREHRQALITAAVTGELDIAKAA